MSDNTSLGGGFVLGFFLGLIGLIIALAVWPSGSNLRRGADYGFLTWVGMNVIMGFICFLAFFAGYHIS